jgi:phosphonate transport system substrate-binding protein
MSKLFANIVWALALGAVIACVSSLQPAAGADGVLKFGITPREAPRIMYTKFSPLADYLSKELGLKVELVVGKDFQSTIDGMGKNEFPVALLTPSAYPKCEKLYPDAGVKPLVRFLSGGRGTYKTCIFVPTDSQLASLGALKGKTFAFGDATSAAASWMPRSMLKSAGIDAEKDLAGYKHVGSHTNVANAVAMKSFDAGACMDSTADRFAKEGKLRIIARSTDMPDTPICVNKHLSADLAEKLKQALLKLKSSDPVGKAVLTPINDKYTGCEPAQAKDYDTIRELVQGLFGDQWHKTAM